MSKKYETVIDFESTFHSMIIHCPVCAKMIFITMIPCIGEGKSTIEAECSHVRFYINDEHYALDIDFLGNKGIKE